MDAKLKAKWIKALRSGKYEQTQRKLRDGNGFCCLGVLGAIQGADYSGMSGHELATSRLPTGYNAGLPFDTRVVLAKLNDSGKSFSEIADYIESNIPGEA